MADNDQIQTIFSDPDFRQLSSVQKIKVLDRVDADFKGLPPQEKAKVIQKRLTGPLPTKPPAGSGIWNTVQDVAASLVSAGASPIYQGGEALRKKMGWDLNLSGPKADPIAQAVAGYQPETTAGKVAHAAEPLLETYAMPEMEATKVPKLLKSGATVLRETAPSLLKRSVFEGAKMGAQAAWHGDKPLPGAILGASAPGAARLLQMAAPELSRTANWLYNRALYPTTKITKAETAEAVPELLQRNFWAATWPRLQNAAQGNLEKAGTDLEKAEDEAVKQSAQVYAPTGGYRTVRKPGTPAKGPVIDIYAGEAAPPGAAKIPQSTEVGRPTGNVGPRLPAEEAGAAGRTYRVYETARGAFDISPVINALHGMMRGLQVRGEFPTQQSETLYNQLADQVSRIQRIGTSVTLPEAIQLRRILDKPLGEKGAFYLDPNWQSLQRVQLKAANTLRGLINDNFPQLAKANGEYHLWKSVNHIMEATGQRKVGQQGLLHLLMSGAAAGEHLLNQGDLVGLVRDVMLANAGAAVLNSPGFHTLSAVQIGRLGRLLDQRDLTGFMRMAGVLVRPSQEGSKQ